MPASAESGSTAQEDRKKAASAPQRPPLRSNFDLEPNPFEQSFSSTRAPSDVSSSSVSSTNNRAGLKQNDASAASPPSKLNGETPKPMLPPLASIASPSGDSFAWGMSATDLGSLRSGPLSPAMLAGPQNTSGVAGSSSSLALAFDASGFGRTGLTPSTGLTPLVAGPVSFPPPSPNTAAFLAMVSNSTTAATLAAGTAATITPNTLSAITGVLNHTAIPQNYSTYAPRSDAAYSAANGSTSEGPSQVNGLFLLSQAHQELAKREEAQRASSAVPSDIAPMNGTTTVNNNAPRRAPKRKTTEPPAPVAAPAAPARNPSKKPRAAASATKSKRGKRAESSSDEDDDGLDSDTMNDAMGGNQSANKSKKPETEEEKRRNFLERNRQAALKCRQRKKAWLAQLQAKVEFLTTENERLNAALLKSSEEINRLTALVNAQSVVTAPPGSVQATVVGAGGRGFGY
ncbi:hypothetical protein AURDEDRAFT_110611 [Auricularia subglabra TFB-10046 SS5]|nr:hypothetical protein AURDEDRAFT_110611 [Auricularia subglabra TFB-10046 SS5]